MAKVVAVVNPKGGCGKTTTTLNLGAGLGKVGYKVVIVDADPQGSLMQCSLLQGQDRLPFDILLGSSVKSARQLPALAYDIVLVDTPAGMMQRPDALFARDALMVADLLVLPIRASGMDFRAAVPFVKFLSKAPVKAATGVLINARRNNRYGKQAPVKAAELVGGITRGFVFESTIGQRTPIEEVIDSGRSIFDYAGAKHLASQEYLALTKEAVSWLSGQK